MNIVRVSSLLLLTTSIAKANPVTAPLELEEGFYNWDCSNGVVEITSKTYECSDTGLYQITASLSSKNGRVIKVELTNERPCEESLWTARVTELQCIDKEHNNNVDEVVVTAHVDPLLWKDALSD